MTIDSDGRLMVLDGNLGTRQSLNDMEQNGKMEMLWDVL